MVKKKLAPGVVVEVVSGKKIWLLWHNKGNKYTSVTGKVDPGETFMEAAIRELGEEMGVKADVTELKLVGNVKDSWQELYIYRIELKSGVLPVNKEPHKHAKLIIVNEREVLNYELFNTYSLYVKARVAAKGSGFIKVQI